MDSYRFLVGRVATVDMFQLGFGDLFQIVDLFQRSVHLRKKSPLA
jgi:hypothetical protein